MPRRFSPPPSTGGPMPPSEGESAPGFEALLCDGETFRARTLEESLGGTGAVLVFFGFVFSAIADNWWRRYEDAGWHGFDAPVYGVGRDGPYAMNRFLCELDSPFELFADVDGAVADAYGLRVERDGMAGVTTARRAIFVLDGDGVVRHRWLGDDWISRVPREEIEDAVASL